MNAYTPSFAPPQSTTSSLHLRFHLCRSQLRHRPPLSLARLAISPLQIRRLWVHFKVVIPTCIYSLVARCILHCVKSAATCELMQQRSNHHNSEINVPMLWAISVFYQMCVLDPPPPAGSTFSHEPPTLCTMVSVTEPLEC